MKIALWNQAKIFKLYEDSKVLAEWFNGSIENYDKKSTSYRNNLMIWKYFIHTK